MDASLIVALAVAALGVAGTLASGILTQRTAARFRMAELEQERNHRKTEDEKARLRSMQERRHACYVALNMADRQFHSLLLLHVDALRTGIGVEESRIDVSASRDVMREQWGEAQLILPDALLPFAARANGTLWKAYEMLRRIEFGNEGSDDTLEMATIRLREAKEKITELREEMRKDLAENHMR